MKSAWRNCTHPRTPENTADGRQCRACKRVSHDHWVESHREYNVARERHRNTGWTPEAFQSAKVRQSGLCAICQKVFPLVADHCHNQNIPRALLCKTCNLMLGYAADDPTTLRRAADYIEQWQAQEITA